MRRVQQNKHLPTEKKASKVSVQKAHGTGAPATVAKKISLEARKILDGSNHIRPIFHTSHVNRFPRA